MDKNASKKTRKPVGASISVEIWNELKIQAIREQRKTGEILDDAILFYINLKTSEAPLRKKIKAPHQ